MAQIIDFRTAAARARQARDREVSADWFAELETWPRAFQEGLRASLEFYLDPHQTPNQRDFGDGRLLKMRARVGGYSLGWFVNQLEADCILIRAAARDYRAARRTLKRAYAIERRRMWLESAKGNLLEHLFGFGWRRVDREVLKVAAETAAAEARS